MTIIIPPYHSSNCSNFKVNRAKGCKVSSKVEDNDLDQHNSLREVVRGKHVRDLSTEKFIYKKSQ